MKYNLSEITDLIKDRRTIYPEQFSDRKIQKDQITNILNNALWAPTHGNTQPWRFVVFTEDSRQDLSTILGKTYLEIIPKENQNDLKLSRMMARPLKSSVVVAVIMNRDETRKISELDEIGAVASAIQNMHLTCTAYGIGGFWATPKVIFTPQMHEFLKIGVDDKCLGLFYMGYPAVEWPKGQRRPLEYVTEWR